MFENTVYGDNIEYILFTLRRKRILIYNERTYTGVRWAIAIRVYYQRTKLKV